jgi:hypothetical protein
MVSWLMVLLMMFKYTILALSPVEVSRLYNRSSTENHAVSPYVSDHNGVVDSALAFDRVDDYVNSSFDVPINAWSSYAVSFWMNPAEIVSGVNQAYLFSQDSARFACVFVPANSAFRCNSRKSDNTGIANDIPISTFTANNWYYVVHVVNNTNSLIYVDGVLLNTTSYASTAFYNLAGTLNIGTQSNLANFFNGSIDDVRVYNRSLGAGDISSIYNNSGFDFKSQLNYSVVWRHPRLNVTAVMGNGSAISAFNVSIGGVTNGTTNGFLQLVLSGLNNFSVQTNSSGFIGRTDLVNVDSLLTPFVAVLSESVVTFRVFDQFTNVQILNFSVTDGYTSKSTVNGVAVLNMGAGVSTVNVSNNVSYYNRSFSVSVVALQNKSVNLSLFNHKLEVHAFNNLSGAEVFNLSVNVTYPNGSGLSLFSSGNNVTLNLSTGVNYSLSVAPTGYAISRANVSGLSGLSSVLNLSVFTTNSLFITFRDSDSHLLFNTSNFGVNANVTISFIGLSALTRMTDNGSLFVSLLSPDTYTLTYSANGFETGKYIISVVNRSYQALTLYLQNDSEASLVLITVKDRFGTELQGVEVTVQKWSNNSWIVDQIVETDFQGRTEAYYVLSTVFYNHVLELDGITYFGAVNDDSNKKLIFAEDVSNGISFNINLLEYSFLSNYYNVTNNIVGNVSYFNLSNSTGYFRFFWSTVDNSEATGCLRVTRGSGLELVCNNCSTTATGIITCSVNQSSGFAVYTASGKIDGWLIDSFSLMIGDRNIPDWGVTGYIFAFFLVLIAFFAFLSNPTISLIVGTGVFATLVFMGVIFKDVNYTALITLLVITYFIASIKSDGGSNG